MAPYTRHATHDGAAAANIPPTSTTTTNTHAHTHTTNPTTHAPPPPRFRTTFRNAIYDVLRARGFRETDSDVEWDFAWVDTAFIREHLDAMHLDDHQRINHFRNF